MSLDKSKQWKNYLPVKTNFRSTKKNVTKNYHLLKQNYQNWWMEKQHSNHYFQKVTKTSKSRTSKQAFH